MLLVAAILPMMREKIMDSKHTYALILGPVNLSIKA